jgi:hypothetical protein
VRRECRSEVCSRIFSEKAPKPRRLQSGFCALLDPSRLVTGLRIPDVACRWAPAPIRGPANSALIQTCCVVAMVVEVDRHEAEGAVDAVGAADVEVDIEGVGNIHASCMSPASLDGPTLSRRRRALADARTRMRAEPNDSDGCWQDMRSRAVLRRT